MKKLLLTGFEPFGGETVNPALEAVLRVDDSVGGYAVRKLAVPVVFGLAGETVLREAARFHPDVILCVGQAGGRRAVTPEQVAINLRDAALPDNAGNAPRELPVVPGGPDGLFSPLPVRRMAEAITRLGLPGAVSYSAGTYVCNDLLYTLLHALRFTPVRAGFLHVPYLPEQAHPEQPSLPLSDIVRALEAALSVL